MLKVHQIEGLAQAEEQGRRTIAAQEDEEVRRLNLEFAPLFDAAEDWGARMRLMAEYRRRKAVIEEWHSAARKRTNGRTYQLATMYLKLNK